MLSEDRAPVSLARNNRLRSGCHCRSKWPGSCPGAIWGGTAYGCGPLSRCAVCMRSPLSERCCVAAVPCCPPCILTARRWCCTLVRNQECIPNPRPMSDLYHLATYRSHLAPRLGRDLRCSGRCRSRRLLGRRRNVLAYIPKYVRSKPCSI